MGAKREGRGGQYDDYINDLKTKRRQGGFNNIIPRYGGSIHYRQV